jgi:hypothetical protein
MPHYFAFGNVWLFVTLTLVLGCKYARSSPDMVSFTAGGGWLYNRTYTLLEMGCLVAAVVCFALWAATSQKKEIP